ncbi:MAG: hypothetical protein OXI80_16000 [Caldilineaceae bacterium]|nr:hypothetical protein [Caldilineaceae bacterium]
MHHFVQKIGSKAAAREAPRARVFELIPTAKSARKRGCLWSVMYSFCTGSGGVLGTRSAWDRKGLGQAWLADDAYEIHTNLASVHPGILTVITKTMVASTQAASRLPFVEKDMKYRTSPLKTRQNTTKDDKCLKSLTLEPLNRTAR